MTDIPQPPASDPAVAAAVPPPAAATTGSVPYEGQMTAASGAGTLSEKDARLWGMLCHLSALAGFIIPFGSIIGPLVIWLIKKNDSPFVDDQGKESLNFQITVIIAAFICGLLMLILIGIFLLIALGITALILIIMASIKANNGIAYRYPFALRLIK